MKQLLLIVTLAVWCTAQSPVFEVASVKLNRAGGSPQLGNEPGRLYRVPYDVEGSGAICVHCSGFSDFRRPDVVRFGALGHVCDGWPQVSDDERKLMLQALLTDRFQMSIRREMKEMPLYALVTAKNGPKLQANTNGNEPRIGIRMGSPGLMQMTGVNVPVMRLAQALVGYVGAIVVDRTEIEGSFDFELEWVPDPANMPTLNGAKPEGAPDGASIFTAVQEQLGLKLESAKGPVEVLVIERAEKAKDN